MKRFEFGMASVDKEKVSIVNNYVEEIKVKYGMLFPEMHVANLYRVIFRSIAITLKHFEAKATPRIGLRVINTSNEFRMGALLTYHKPEEGEENDSGNWNLSFTFNEADMKDLDKEITSMDESFFAVAATELYNAIFGHFETPDSCVNMIDAAIAVIVKFLDTNSDDGEDVELILNGIFEASVGFENGTKVFSIVPGAVIKQLIKDDEALSK